jgi:hypothetical protein
MPEPEKVQDLPREDYTVPGMIFDAQLEKHRPKRKAIRPVTIATAACQFCKKRKIRYLSKIVLQHNEFDFKVICGVQTLKSLDPSVALLSATVFVEHRTKV